MELQGQWRKQFKKAEMCYPVLSFASWQSGESAPLTFCMRWVSMRSRQAPVAALQALKTISPYASNTDLRPETIWLRITAVSSYTILGCKQSRLQLSSWRTTMPVILLMSPSHDHLICGMPTTLIMLIIRYVRCHSCLSITNIAGGSVRATRYTTMQLQCRETLSRAMQ